MIGENYVSYKCFPLIEFNGQSIINIMAKHLMTNKYPYQRRTIRKFMNPGLVK